MAASLGANETFKVESRNAKEVANSITTKFGYADRTIECTGAEPSMQTAIYVSPISKVAFFGYFNKIIIIKSHFVGISLFFTFEVLT